MATCSSGQVLTHQRLILQSAAATATLRNPNNVPAAAKWYNGQAVPLDGRNRSY
ncbi:MAG: hypothetical protein IPN94_02770 [Sphingobacteriales bacterium]|nr:hypothetical protein [Sphingobacteriales bacterium]